MSSLVASMFMEELRSLCRVLNDINLELSDKLAFFTVGQADYAVYFTQEQLTVGLHFPVSSLVKQFLHVTWALIHPNAFQILMSCSVLNFLYQLDILLVEICFFYTLKLGIGG